MKNNNDSLTAKQGCAEGYIVNDPLHHLFDHVDSIAVQGYDKNRKVIYWNQGSEQLYGYSASEACGKKLEELIIPESMREFVIKAHTDWVDNNIEIPASELTLCCKDGTSVQVFSSHVLFKNKHNENQMYCIDINLSDVKSSEAKAQYTENVLVAAFEAIPDLFFLMNEHSVIIDFHANNHGDLYLDPKDFLGKAMLKILPENVAGLFKENIQKLKDEQGVVTFGYKLSLPEGEKYFEARLSLLPNEKHVIAIVRDISEQHKTEQIIKHQAHYDSLTLLPNRFLALTRLEQLLSEANRNNEKIAVLFLDLDDFKKVNDSLGHDVGDKVLIESGQRLIKVVRKEDTVGRLGGDEFIILLRGLSISNDALPIAEGLLKTFRKPFKINGRELIITVSVGIAIYPDNGITSEKLLCNADIAMYQAKGFGRNTYSFFTKAMNVKMLRRLEVEEQIQGALARNEFEVYYQPQIDALNHKLIGAEALLRWHNIVLGEVAPDEFIPIAEHTGLIIPIGQFVLKQALEFLNKWMRSKNINLRMTVNLSPRQFRDPKLLYLIKQLLLDNSLKAKNLAFEITEGVLITGHSYVDDALVALNHLGIKLSMDDFGTGYSSLSYLRQYAFDIVKIDRSFIHNITTNKSDCDLVNATIAMAHSLGLKVVAEGVETKEQLDILSTLFCDYVQGYYFSKPVPAKKLLDYTQKR
ncbi:MAG: EAL domain-containing protein [Colwellia sp.]